METKNLFKNFELQCIIGFIPAGCLIGAISSIGSIAINIVNSNRSGIVNSIILAIISVVVMIIFSKTLKNN